nr:site-specific integrase [Afipia massiliensis]
MNVDGPVWNFTANGKRFNLNFRDFERWLSSPTLDAFKRVLAHALTIQSPYTVMSSFRNMGSFCRYSAETDNNVIDAFTPAAVLNYYAGLDQRRRWYMGRIIGLLRLWHELGYQGVPLDTYKILDELSPGRNPLGEAVLTHDPLKGPLSDVELEGLIAALQRSFERRETDLQSFVLVWLLLATGRRNIQLAALKLRDFRVDSATDGTRFYWLDVPRAKQKGLSIRATSRPFKLSPQVGELVEILVGYRRTIDARGDEAPLFAGLEEGGGPGLEGHLKADQVKYRLQSIVDRLKVTSPRTGEPLHITPRRLRYTMGTRAAAEGGNEYKIAELLDHSTSETARIYVKASPQMLERIDRAIAEELAPFAQAFAGVLIDHESDARRGQDPNSRIIDPTITEGPVGSCGTFSFCALSAPIACYTCINFQPWLDGPHEDVLTDLLAKRESMIERNGDIRIASINDRTILAVTRVVQLCREKQTTAAIEGGDA